MKLCTGEEALEAATLEGLGGLRGLVDGTLVLDQHDLRLDPTGTPVVRALDPGRGADDDDENQREDDASLVEELVEEPRSDHHQDDDEGDALLGVEKFRGASTHDDSLCVYGPVMGPD